MTTYALIHGAWGSGWHWASIPERLRAAGHDVVAPDLPCDDVDATFDDYARVVVDALGGADDVVIVGFSLGGLTAARVPGRAHVYVAALVPESGRSLKEQFGNGSLLHPDYLPGIAFTEDGSMHWTDFDIYRRVAYDDDVPEAVAHERFQRLRAQHTAAYAAPFTGELPEARYVRCTQDQLVNNAYWATRVDVTDELDCGHSAMVSRPDELTELLLRST